LTRFESEAQRPASGFSPSGHCALRWAEMQNYSNGGAYLNFPGQGEEGEKLLRAS
jgi:hypothetical protein